ncbi:MAG: hypothetical protein H7Y08_03975 [Rhizobiaceae bacterium]|nr:hypothetical protein [Rhizobiaceae bacterium]
MAHTDQASSQASFGPVPLRYRPDFERLEPEEAETSAAIVEAMHTILDTTFKDSGRAVAI